MLTYTQFEQFVRQSIPRFGQQWLNGRQRDAVQAPPHPPTFIVAGPGAGKTTVLALRVLKLILVDGIRPGGVIATTFTRKAAGELRSRILAWGYAVVAYARQATEGHPQLQRWLQEIDINGVMVGTLDSLSEQILLENRPPGGISPATIEAFFSRAIMLRQGLFSDGRFQSRRLEAFLATFVPAYPGPRPLRVKLPICLAFADRVRHDEMDLQAFSAGDEGRTVMAAVLRDYFNYLEANHLADFARLERLLLERLQRNELQRVCEATHAILVDEFQDTNYLQEQIYFDLCRRTTASLTVVGDDDQSIFRFRGATVEIFANFENRMAHNLGEAWRPQRVDLVENYRSSSAIVQFCNRFVHLDPAYQPARVMGKQALIASASHAHAAHHPPVLGMFRTEVTSLANDLGRFLWSVFRGDGYQVQCQNQTFRIVRGVEGDFGDAVLLGHRAQEYAYGDPPRPRLPLLMRNLLESTYGVPVFNPRGRSLCEIGSVQQLLGLALLCIDGDGAALQNLRHLSPTIRTRIQNWRISAEQFANGNPEPGGLPEFIRAWRTRTLPPGSHMRRWPSEWPLLELAFTLITWLPQMQRDPEGQVYLEALARTISETGQFSAYGARILNGMGVHDANSVAHAIREVFVSVADENVEVDEEIMPYVPRSYFPIMTIHQSKGLEFPLVVVDVGSDFPKNYHAQRKFRFPGSPDTVHVVEDLVATSCPIGQVRTQRDGLDRAWDDLRRLYYVGYSRPENVLLLAGLTSQIGPNPRVQSVATGDLRNSPRLLNFLPAVQWHADLTPDHVALI